MRELKESYGAAAPSNLAYMGEGSIVLDITNCDGV
jgi:hypothetical protein